MNIAYLILGGNKGDKKNNLQSAIQLIEERAGMIVRKSDVFVTAAWGNSNQPDFFNQVVCIHTLLSATNLLNIVLEIEMHLGRVRQHSEKWMERTMDIDILFFNNEIINTPDLKIPHPYIQERKFVLIPMNQIAATLIHPTFNKSIEKLLNESEDDLEVTLVGNY